MDIVMSVILFAGALGGLFLLWKGNKQHNKGLLIIGGALAVVCTLIVLINTFSCSSGDFDSEKLQKFEQIAGKYAGNSLQGKKVLVILDDGLQTGEMNLQNLIFEAFKSGIGSEPEVIRIPRLNTFGMPREKALETVTAYFEAFDKAYAKADADGCDVIVQFAGMNMPRPGLGIERSMPEKAKILLMPTAIRFNNAMACNIANELFESNVLYGIIVEKAGFSRHDDIPENVTMAFDKYFVLITPDNRSEYPQYLEAAEE